ncbi:radical SAM/SPASM domain-containing protein [Campylobacter fetus]|uniref:radical SAM/SPASM domain-containing protein n=2 Tax=Campylobacter fetus TaxID=196 RepID=UPI0003C26A38|nr:radical SAM protein [Campylobacter fetus]AGZ82389.1 radical SAM superfamily enzyme, MoaA/NifB/PqqE/SkfB family (SPASM domain) [Campylobacter fetus subsp. testudinum 03-427]AJB46113.1 radical SAM protein [Campylobacter fetus subsp. testudinum]AVK81800.1 radical SAM/SPASM domain-containing protein [Campylobacter fetus subsp. testudinum]EAI4322688.1 radical SAM protein [Campylobacter fetus]EAI4392080.1 radical SAM protein [Campylobacter fetus]
MKDKFRIDSHKLIFHPKRVSNFLDALGNWEKEKDIYPIYVEFSPCGACNHRCTFCGLDYMGYKNIKISLEAFKKTSKDMAECGVKSIMFAGEGEPLLHKDLPSMAEFAKMQGIDLGLTTNFALTNTDISKSLLKNFTWIKVSLNGANAQNYAMIHKTKASDFDKVINNLKEAIKIRKENKFKCSIGVQLLLLKENIDYVLELAKILRDIDVDYFVIKPYSQHLFSITKEHNAFKYINLESLANSLYGLQNDNFSVIFRYKTMQKKDSSKHEYKKCYSTPYFWAYVSSNGDLYSCSCYLGDDKFKFGNINDKSFRELWQSDKRKQNINFVQNSLNISQCRVNCRMDFINSYLWELKNPNEHVNFI